MWCLLDQCRLPNNCVVISSPMKSILFSIDGRSLGPAILLIKHSSEYLLGTPPNRHISSGTKKPDSSRCISSPDQAQDQNPLYVETSSKCDFCVFLAILKRHSHRICDDFDLSFETLTDTCCGTLLTRDHLPFKIHEVFFLIGLFLFPFLLSNEII